jgi:hypothetical protein
MLINHSDIGTFRVLVSIGAFFGFEVLSQSWNAPSPRESHKTAPFSSIGIADKSTGSSELMLEETCPMTCSVLTALIDSLRCRSQNASLSIKDLAKLV